MNPQTMMGRSPQCYIPSFVEIGPPVPENNIFDGYLPYTGHFGHVTSIITDINFIVPESLHTKFGSKRPSGF